MNSPEIADLLRKRGIDLTDEQREAIEQAAAAADVSPHRIVRSIVYLSITQPDALDSLADFLDRFSIALNPAGELSKLQGEVRSLADDFPSAEDLLNLEQRMPRRIPVRAKTLEALDRALMPEEDKRDWNSKIVRERA